MGVLKSVLFIGDTEIPQNIAVLLKAAKNAREADRWLKTPNPDLKGDTPLARIQAGDVQAVINVIPIKSKGMYS